MKPVILGVSLWLLCFFGLDQAQAIGVDPAKCKKLAHEFSEDSDSLNEEQLKQLQYCVTRTLEQRYQTDPPELLKGTIIEPPASSIAPPPALPPVNDK